MSEPAPDPAPTIATGDEPRSRPAFTWWLLAGSVAAVVALGVLFAAVGGDDRGDDQAAATAALAIPVTTADGGTTTLGAYRGDPLVVNFFASWCPPCRAEMPELERAHQAVRSDVRFVGVSVDYDETTWKSLVAESGITFETVFEPRQDLLRAVGGKGMPTTILVGADGTIRHVHTGALTEGALLDLIDDRLAA